MFRPHLPTRSLLLLCLVGGLLGALSACGQPVVGGAGRIAAGDGGGPAHVIVEGSPYEMGYWQGRLLADRIRLFHPPWQELGLGGGESGRTLRSAFEVYVDQTLRLLPEAIRQELDGLAAGSGLPVADLLLTEVTRDARRFHGLGPRLKGDLACRGAGGEVEAIWDGPGPDARRLGEGGILLERRPRDGTPTVLVTWPGSLGGVAGASVRGLAVVTAAVPLPTVQQSLGGLPFTLHVRAALEEGRTVDDLLDLLSGSTAHRALLLDGRRGQALFGLAALSATRTADVSALPFFEVAASVPVGEAVVKATPGQPDALRKDFLDAVDGHFGVRVDATEAVVSLGYRQAALRVRLPLVADGVGR